MTRPRPLLNLDLGEHDDEPEELFALADVVNVACGGHAGDDASMARAVERARARGAAVAAHPSYPDRAGFGRATMALSPSDLAEHVRSQCAALARIAYDARVPVTRVKAHGALYHDATRDPVVARSLARGARRGLGVADLVFVGARRGELARHADALGLPFEREGFADRVYLPTGELAPRSQPGALISSPAEAATQALALADRGDVETICVHADTPGAVEIARAVREGLLALSRETFGP
ncbi:MAG: LamB/YcsF family protein [Polyangiaceae bacterium]|nr:LamB/YcsF family protein [Polyangiaceae bacterium]